MVNSIEQLEDRLSQLRFMKRVNVFYHSTFTIPKIHVYLASPREMEIYKNLSDLDKASLSYIDVISLKASVVSSNTHTLVWYPIPECL